MRFASLQELLSTLRAVDNGAALSDVLLPTTRKLFRAQHATLWLPAAGRYPESLLSSRAPLPGLVDNTPTPVRFRDLVLRSERAVALNALSDLGLHEEFEKLRIKDAIGVALRSGPSVIGTLEVAGRADHLPYFDADDVSALEIIGGNLSATVENSRLIDRLRFDAYHDALTRLPNRRRLVEALEEAVAVRAPGEVVAVIEFDVSDLRVVNDSLGHDAGNRLLVEMAQRLKDLAPPAALVGRVGGDEFVVLMRMSSVDDAMSLATDLRSAVVRNVTEIGSVTLAFEAAAGIAVHPDHGSDPAILLQRADVATHVAKSMPLPVQLFNPGLESRATRRLGLAGDLRQALANEEIEVYFQPKISLATWDVVGVECLVRWEHPAHGWVSPADFVAVAEHTGQLGRLTEVALAEGLRCCRRLADAGSAVGVSINVSPVTLMDAGFPEQVLALLDRHGVDPGQLTLEIPEDVTSTVDGRTMPILGRLHEAGVRLSVDDFGTGYSSLSYLRRLPVQEVKINNSFIQGMTVDPSDLAIVRAIVGLASQFGLTVVAEGVESELTLSLLSDIGCDVGQGFLFSRPLPFDRLTAWLAARTETQQTTTHEVRRLRNLP
jgi:diguanylate cyclase (GGDEF)-like protein